MSWRAFHFYYHADRDVLLRLLVAPLWQAWRDRNRVAQAFFIRYPLGGDHVRFRFLPADEDPTRSLEMERELVDQAENFFRLHPSTSGKSQELLEADAQAILASDPGETDPRIFPDNSWQKMEFVPEVDRYGGPDVLPDSFGLFDLSSRRILEILLAEPEMRRSRRLTTAMSVIAELASAFSRNGDELGQLIDYGNLWTTPALIDKADQVFEAQAQTLSSALLDIVRRFSAATTAEDPKTPLAQGASSLRNRLEVAAIPQPRIMEIGKSHLHMTSNRLGLTNYEEAYLSRLLARCFVTWQAQHQV